MGGKAIFLNFVNRGIKTAFHSARGLIVSGSFFRLVPHFSLVNETFVRKDAINYSEAK